MRFSHPIPRALGARGIVLYPFVLFDRPRADLPRELLVHEMIHVRQIRRIGWITFYFSYLREYVAHRIRGLGHNAAYFAIRFEREAYGGQSLVCLTEDELRELA